MILGRKMARKWVWLTRSIAVSAVMVVIVACVDLSIISSKSERAARAVRELGGRIGSIPVWPLGSDYYVSFPRPLGATELERLHVLNTLRGHVNVAWNDSELTKEQIQLARSKLGKCVVWNKQSLVPAPTGDEEVTPLHK